ncbi:MAG: hypothetical protein WCP35_20505, partial [Verrucomicrobiota bacterium]
GSMVLHDVHLHILKWVVRSWCERARLLRQGDGRRAPVISFPPLVGEIATGEVILCSVENGPSLTAFERALVKAAFWYRPSRRGTLSLSTKMMLEEIGVEVEAAAEQRRFGAAEAGLRNVIRLHKTLLLASAADKKGTTENAATIGTSPYSWSTSSFDIEWLKPYREIGRVAVACLEEDSRLFKALAVIPAIIATELPPKPEKLFIDAMLVGLNLTHQLGGWWTRKADASIAPGTTSYSGTLPAPLSKVYEQALIAFVGSWGHLNIRIPESTAADEVGTWAAITARALVYADHIEKSAQMFLKAVSRGDEVASTWLLDSLLKWWGNRQHELEYGDPDDFQVRHVTLSLAEKTWMDAQSFLWDGENPVTVDVASKALNLAIRRYWESMRLYVALLLIHNAGATPAANCRELRLAAAIIKGTAQQRGGNAECWPLDNVDAAITAVLGAVFGVQTVVSRIDGFAEKLRWENEAPEVSGWIYGWSGTPTDLESMKRAQATLLVAVTVPRGPRFGTNQTLIESWWKDLDKLDSVASFCQDLRRQVLSEDFSSALPAIAALQTHLSTTCRVRSARLAIAQVMKKLRKVALYERLITLRVLDVDEHVVRRIGDEIANLAFDPQFWHSLPGTTVRFVPRLAAGHQSVTFDDYKTRFVTGGPQQPDAGLAEHMAECVRRHAVAWSFSRRVAEFGLVPANAMSLRDNYQATVGELQAFISSVGALCTSLRSAGTDPLVLVGRTAPSSYLRPYKWGPSHWQCPLPTDVTLRSGDPSKGEAATVFVNEAPVYEFDTPNGDCYVVPASIVKTLEVDGTDPLSALHIKWTQVGEERLQFVVTWKAKFA